MEKIKSKANKEKNPIAGLQALSLDARRSIAKVLDVALRNFEIDSFGYGDMRNGSFYRLLFILDRTNKELNQGEAWTVLRGINKYIDGFQFIPAGVEQSERGREWLDLIQQLQYIRKTLGDLHKDHEPMPTKWFNPKNNSISFYGNIYKPRNELQAKFIRQLVMKHQRENNKGTVLKEGQRVSEKNLSSEINLTIEQLRHIKKQLQRSFKDKGFPLKIDSHAEGILLVYTI